MAGSRKFTVAEMDRVVPIVAYAIGVFGVEQKASRWFRTPLPLLGNVTPSEVLARGGGEEIDNILTRIEHNIPS